MLAAEGGENFGHLWRKATRRRRRREKFGYFMKEKPHFEGTFAAEGGEKIFERG